MSAVNLFQASYKKEADQYNCDWREVQLPFSKAFVSIRMYFDKLVSDGQISDEIERDILMAYEQKGINVDDESMEMVQ